MRQTPVGSSRFKRSKGALRRQKYVTSGASKNMSATLQNCRNPCMLLRNPIEKKIIILQVRTH